MAFFTTVYSFALLRETEKERDRGREKIGENKSSRKGQKGSRRQK